MQDNAYMFEYVSYVKDLKYLSDGIRIDFSITRCSFDFSYMLMYQAVAGRIAQLLENHRTGNNSHTLVSGTTFSDKHKAALFYLKNSFLMKLEVVHTSFLNDGQCSTDTL